MKTSAALIAPLLLALGGCATTTPTLSELVPADPARVSFQQAPAADSASLTVARDKAFAGSAVNYLLLIDGRLAAKIATGEFVRFDLPAGEHILEIRHPSATLGAVGDAAVLKAEPAAKYFYRINSDVGVMRLLRTTEASLLEGL
jgi:hypothetical protein